MAKPIPLFGLGLQAQSPTVSMQRHCNLYAQVQQEAEKSRVVFYGTPGTVLRTTFGDTPVRGWIAVGSLYYAVWRGTLYSVNNAGTKVSLGMLSTTSGRVDMAYDGAVILIVTGATGYTLTLPSTFATVTDGDFPDAARTCAWLGSQFIVDDGVADSIFVSPDGTSWDAADFATAESNPDGLVRVFADNGELLLAGENTLEYWSASGGADFPFSPVGGATQEFGLAARWSLTKFNSGMAGVFRSNTNSQVAVMFIQGYVPKPLSSPEHAATINAYSTVSDATAYSYMLGTHPMLVVNFPTAGKSWLYDALTGMWSPLEYGLTGARHRGELHLAYNGTDMIADYENGNVYNLSATTYTDNGTQIAREIIGKHFFDGNERFTIDELYVDMETGVGIASGQGSNPQAMLSISKNNGRSWGSELWVEMGLIGNYLTRAVWRRLGIARDWLFKIRITDPVRVAITYAAVKARK